MWMSEARIRTASARIWLTSLTIGASSVPPDPESSALETAPAPSSSAASSPSAATWALSWPSDQARLIWSRIWLSVATRMVSSEERV